MPYPLPILFAALFGFAIGSFGTMLLDRMPKGEELTGRSRCPHCGTVIHARDLIPVVSFFLLGGKCRSCGKKIPWRYPYLEACMALVFALLMTKFPGQPLPLLLLAAACTMLLLIAFYDFASERIPDAFVAVLFLAALGAATVRGLSDPGALRDAFLGAAIPLTFFGWLFVVGNAWNQVRSRGLVQLLFSSSLQHPEEQSEEMSAAEKRGAGWIGSGDILLGAAIGLLLGLHGTLLTLFLAYVIGAVIVSILIVAGRVGESRTIAFGPFLSLAALTALLFGERLIVEYQKLLFT